MYFLMLPLAERGGAFLDVFRPGWEKEIDLGILDANDPEKSVPGQLFSHLSKALLNLNIGESDAKFLGFILPQDTFWANFRLTEGWRTQVRIRRLPFIVRAMQKDEKDAPV